MKKFLIFTTLILLSATVYCNDFVNQKLNEQDELIDNIEVQIINMTQTISLLKSGNDNLNKHTTELEIDKNKMSQEISSLKNVNKELHTALNSNKEDTHEVINILGDMSEEISKINKQKELANKFIQMTIPATTLPLITSGAYLYFTTNEKDLSKLMMMCGGGLLIGGELIWNGGKFIFKIW